MNTEMTYLALTAVLAASLWIPYIVGVNKHPSEDIKADFLRPRDLSTVPAWVHRAHRAHLNLLEQFLPMAALVLIAGQAGISTPVIGWAVAIFFWLRVVHAIGMISGLALFPFRSIVFSAGWICTLAVASQVLLA